MHNEEPGSGAHVFTSIVCQKKSFDSIRDGSMCILWKQDTINQYNLIVILRKWILILKRKLSTLLPNTKQCDIKMLLEMMRISKRSAKECGKCLLPGYQYLGLLS